MIVAKKFESVKPGMLFKVRATCSFAPSEDCINEEGHIYASNGIIELEKDTILMLIEAKYMFCDWNQLRRQQMIVFKFITGQREVYLPITSEYVNEKDFNKSIETFLELFLVDIDKSVDRTVA